MSVTRLALVVAIVGVGIAPALGQGQTTNSAGKQPAPVVDPRDTLYLRARKLVLDGNGAAGRALVDSALTATTGTAEYATALYWRGALSATAADAERDYRRVIVEYPFSPHSGDALLALAQLEMARGDREPAIDHLQRFLLQRPNDPDRVRASIWLGRMLLDQNQLAKGCAVLQRTRASLGEASVEVRNQIDYYAGRCAGVDTAVAPTAVTAPATQPASPLPRPQRAETTAAPRRAAAESARTDSAPKSGRFTVQVAAYQSRDSAEQLLTKLAARGITARVAGSVSPPYRVRIGYYPTDAAATAAARDLKEKGIVGFVTTTDNERAAAPARP